MNTTFLSVFIFILWAISSLLIAYSTIERRGFQERVVRYLVIFLLASFLWEVIRVFLIQGGIQSSAVNKLLWIPFYGVLLLAFLFLLLTLEFLPGKFNRLVCVGLGAISLLPVPLVVITGQAFKDVPSGSGITATWQLISMLVICWLTMISETVYLTVRGYHSVKLPLYKNRIVYWGIALALTGIGDMLLFAGSVTAGSGFRLAGSLVAAYVVLIHNLADLLQTGLRIFNFVIVGLISVIIYSATFALAITLLQAKEASSATLVVAILVFGLAFLVNPLLNFGGRWVGKQIYRQGYNPQAIVREYSSSISNLVNLEVLSKVALVMIGKTFDVEHRNLLMVDEEEGDDQKGYCRLWAISEGEERVLRSPGIQVNSPVGVYFRKERRSLLQYDFDYLQQFQGTPSDVRKWFSQLEADLYIPIYSKGKWIGLFVLGPKSSGDRYFPEDLVLLGMLADQTSVSLENARLFDNLKELNQNLVQAQKALEKANQQLREIDELKSNFISVITHELRTPIANVSFSLQLIEMYGLENLLPEQREQIVQMASGVMQAKTMVDNLITFAVFLNKRVELSLEPLDFKEVIQESLTPLINKAKEKGVLLHLEIVGDLLPVVADHKHLVNAIYQLVDNAIKFTGTDGKVWVDSWTTSENVFLNVRDTGRGVPQDELPFLWNGFTQLADPLRRGLEGLGLGLALVKYIVAAHEGKVWAESLEGTGSAFGFQVPLEGPRISAGTEYDFQKLDDAPRPQEVV